MTPEAVHNSPPDTSSPDMLTLHIEALIFCAPQPLLVEEIRQCLSEALGVAFSSEEVKHAIEVLVGKYASGTHAFELISIGGGFRFMSKPAYERVVAAYLKNTSKKRLSRSVLETLSIIAYKQPVSRTEIELIRGVSSDHAVKKLLERELIEIKGKSEAIGRPLLYGTTPKFLSYFGINGISELPSPREFREEDLSEKELTAVSPMAQQ